jgi:hypothetical protein
MREHVLQILLCYIIGIIVGNLVFLPFLGPVVMFTIIGGWFIGLLELFLTILIFALFRRSILRHLLPWCVAAPFLIATVWLAFEWNIYSSRAPDISWFLSLRGVWDRTALASLVHHSPRHFFGTGIGAPTEFTAGTDPL